MSQYPEQSSSSMYTMCTMCSYSSFNGSDVLNVTDDNVKMPYLSYDSVFSSTSMNLFTGADKKSTQLTSSVNESSSSTSSPTSSLSSLSLSTNTDTEYNQSNSMTDVPDIKLGTINLLKHMYQVNSFNDFKFMTDPTEVCNSKIQSVQKNLLTTHFSELPSQYIIRYEGGTIGANGKCSRCGVLSVLDISLKDAVANILSQMDASDLIFNDIRRALQDVIDNFTKYDQQLNTKGMCIIDLCDTKYWTENPIRLIIGKFSVDKIVHIACT